MAFPSSLRKWLRQSRLILLVFVCAAALSVGSASYFAAQASTYAGGSWDIGLRWATMRTMLAGENPYAMKLKDRQSPHVDALVEEAQVKFMPDYLPSALSPIIPFALLSFDAARVLWLITSLLATFALLWMVYQLALSSPRASRAPPITRRKAIIAGCLFLCSWPLRFTLGIGQLGLVSLAALVGAVLLAREERWVIAGLLAAISLLKYTLVWPLFIFFFLLSRHWKAGILALGIHGAIHLLLTLHMDAHPVWILPDILELNSRVAARGDIFNLWVVLRALAPESLSGALAIAGLTGILFGLGWLWRRQGIRRDTLAWLSILGMTSSLVIGSKRYNDIYLLFAIFWMLYETRLPLLRGLVWTGIFHFLFARQIEDGRIPERIGMDWQIQLEQLIWIDAVFFFAMYISAVVLLARGSPPETVDRTVSRRTLSAAFAGSEK